MIDLALASFKFEAPNLISCALFAMRLARASESGLFHLNVASGLRQHFCLAQGLLLSPFPDGLCVGHLLKLGKLGKTALVWQSGLFVVA